MEDVTDRPPAATDLELRKRRDELKLARLRHHLSRTRWPSGEAAWIIAGIDPEATREGPGDFAFLPGGFRDDWLAHNGCLEWWQIREYANEEIAEVKSFISGDARFPIEWISIAQEKAYDPPWLQIARHDPECKLALEQLTSADPIEARRRGGDAKAAKSSQGECKLEVLRAWYEWKNTPSLYPNRKAFEEALLFKYYDPDGKKNGSIAYVTGERTIPVWVRELDAFGTPKWAIRAKEELERRAVQSA